MRTCRFELNLRKPDDTFECTDIIFTIPDHTHDQEIFDEINRHFREKTIYLKNPNKPYTYTENLLDSVCEQENWSWRYADTNLEDEVNIYPQYTTKTPKAVEIK